MIYDLNSLIVHRNPDISNLSIGSRSDTVLFSRSYYLSSTFVNATGIFTFAAHSFKKAEAFSAIQLLSSFHFNSQNKHWIKVFFCC